MVDSVTRHLFLEGFTLDFGLDLYLIYINMQQAVHISKYKFMFLNEYKKS